MKDYRVKVKGFDTCEWGSTEKYITIKADDDNQAKEKAEKWCESNTYMGGYEWYVKEIVPGRAELKENTAAIIPNGNYYEVEYNLNGKSTCINLNLNKNDINTIAEWLRNSGIQEIKIWE